MVHEGGWTMEGWMMMMMNDSGSCWGSGEGGGDGNDGFVLMTLAVCLCYDDGGLFDLSYRVYFFTSLGFFA